MQEDWCPRCQKYVSIFTSKFKSPLESFLTIVYHCNECKGFLKSNIEIVKKENQVFKDV